MKSIIVCDTEVLTGGNLHLIKGIITNFHHENCPPPTHSPQMKCSSTFGRMSLHKVGLNLQELGTILTGQLTSFAGFCCMFAWFAFERNHFAQLGECVIMWLLCFLWQFVIFCLISNKVMLAVFQFVGFFS